MGTLSFKELKISAESGTSQAQFELAEKYREGCGIFKLKNYKKAIIWYKAAAERGHAKAQVCLGDMLFHGKGVAIDCNQAYNWYKAAADQGNSQGYLRLASFYFSGLVVDQNMEETLSCFKKAALLGSSAACGMLSILYENSNNELHNYEESYFWNVIYKYGRTILKESQSYIDSIERNLTSQQRSEIERKAVVWLHEHQVSIEE